MLRDRPWTMWRYREWLPLADGETPITLGEGGTPLLHAARLAARHGFADLLVKEEGTNPTGSFELGGPHADCGLTGRKIIVDTYGGMARHGGGAFSGKDPTKVDRSGAYAARWAAKNIVAAGLARRCEIQLAYAIGVAEPVSVYVDTFGTGTVPDERIAAAVRQVFDFTPRSIIRTLCLDKPIYKATAAYGHFGREPRAHELNGRTVQLFPWERTDRVDELVRTVG